MARDDPTIYMRIPQELKNKLDAAAAESRRSLTSEVVDRLQRSFSAQAGVDWELRVALHTNEVRLETLQTHAVMAKANIEMLEMHLAEMMGRGAVPQATAHLQDEIAAARRELASVEAKRAKLMEEGERLEKARRESDRQVLGLLDKLADGAMQDDLKELHALEERMGAPKEGRSVDVVPRADRANRVLAVGMDAYKAMLDEALAARDAQLREWWMNEFGYDPQAPKVEREQSKGPIRSANARRAVPKKPAK